MSRTAFPGTHSLRACLLAILVFLLAACGGGGGDIEVAVVPPASTIISGTAAAGAPIIGTVTIKDSSVPPQTRSVAIEADGRYQVDVAGLTAPFMLRAAGTVGGRNYSLYSAAAAPDVGGTINITPLTDLIVANIAGQIAATVYASGSFAGFTTAELSSAEAQLRARLLPILSAVGVGGSIDLLRATFSANHSGLDSALDAIRVEVDPATALATITNLIDDQQIVDNLASRSDTSVLGATSVATAVGDFQQIVAVFDAFNALFATSVPASTNAALIAALSDDFLLDGQNRTAFLSEITSQNLVGLKLTVVALQPGSMLPATAPTTAVVEVFVKPPNEHGETMFLTVKKVSGSWRIAGNGRIAEVQARSFARKQDLFVGTVLQPNVIDSGLEFGIRDTGAVGINYAVVKGNGLPTGGLLYVNYTRNDSFGVAQGPYSGETTPRLLNNGHNQYPMSDSVIGALSDTEAYTIELWKDNATPSNTADDVKVATYTTALTKRPYRVSELTVSSFAAVTGPSKTALQAFAANGGTVQVTWTLPAGLSSSGLHFFRSGSGGFDSLDVDLTAAQTTASLTIGARTPAFGTLQAAGLNLHAVDAFGRTLVTIYNAQ